MTWYKNNIIKGLRETYVWAIFPLIFALIFLLWWYWLWFTFKWQEISPISPLEVPVRLFYSALVFLTLGRFLYKMHVYEILHTIFVRILWAFGLYRKIKEVIWMWLMWLMYLIIVPFVVDLLNNLISFFYNIFGLIIYLAPAFWISLVIFIIFLLTYSYIKEKRKIRIKWI